MADGGLSQEEIDALLAGTDFEDFDVSQPATESPAVSVNTPRAESPSRAKSAPKSTQPLTALHPDKVLNSPNLQLLLDVTMEMTVELGRAKMRVKDILTLGPGSILELEKMAGESVDLMVNNQLMARGEVIVIDEFYGVRITEIIDPMERFKKLTQF